MTNLFPEPAPETNGTSKAARKPPADDSGGAVWKDLCDIHKEHGRDYPLRLSEDTKAAKNIAHSCTEAGISPVNRKRILEMFFLEREDRYVVDGGNALRLLPSRFAKYARRLGLAATSGKLPPVSDQERPIRDEAQREYDERVRVHVEFPKWTYTQFICVRSTLLAYGWFCGVAMQFGRTTVSFRAQVLKKIHAAQQEAHTEDDDYFYYEISKYCNAGADKPRDLPEPWERICAQPCEFDEEGLFLIAPNPAEWNDVKACYMARKKELLNPKTRERKVVFTPLSDGRFAWR